jgi:hypothetical protein
MLTPEIVQKLRDKYGLAVGMSVEVDGRIGKLMNVRFDPDRCAVQFLDKERGVYYSEPFPLSEVRRWGRHT